jgi:PAS domain S-box-containing protein
MTPQTTSAMSGAPRSGMQDVAEVLESISDAFFALDHDWRFTYLNTAAEKLLARGRSELLGRRIWDEFPQALGTAFDQQLHRAAAGKVTAEFEEYYPPLEKWFAVRAYPTPGGLSVYFQNVNERRQAQGALRKSEERAREVAEHLSFALAAADMGDWDWDAATDLIQISPRAAEIFGIPHQPTPTREKMRELISDAHRDRARQAVERAVEEDGRYNIEYQVKRPDGKELWVRADGRSRYDAQGRVVSMAGIVQDITHRKQAEAALLDLADKFAQQSRLFDQIASTTLDFIYVFDLDGRFLYANRRLLEVWGTTFEQAVGKNLYELGYPKWHADMHMRELRQVIETRKPIKGDVPFTGASGISGFYEYIFTPVLDADGQVEVIAGTTRDVTERKSAEEQKARDALLLANVRDSVIVTDLNGIITFWNEGAARLFGWTAAEMLGKPYAERLPESSRAEIESWIERLAAGSAEFSGEWLDCRKDGSSVWIEATTRLIHDPAGQPLGIMGVARDISERKQAEQERIRLSAERDQQLRTFDTVLASLQEFVYLFDLDGRFTYVNKPLLDLWKKPLADVMGKTFADLGYPPELVTLHRSQIEQVIQTKRPVRGENPYTTVEGETREYEYIFVPLFAPDGAVEAVGGATRDVTDQRRHAAAREQLLAAEQAARSEAERTSRMKDEFLATLSHELRTPLNAILGWSQILSDGGRDANDLSEGLRTIERNARAQSQIMEDLLDMSRIISGKIRLDVQRVDLAPVVQAAVDAVRPAADAKGVRLQVVLDPYAGPVSGDPTRLQQIFWNLLSNAMKFTPRDGRVHVLLERVNSHLEISIIDTGEGIAPEFLPYVFDRFRQADASTTRRHGGLGLGLAIVKQLVELHGGSVRAKSPGKKQGTTFTVALPLTPMHPDPQPAQERRHPKAPDPSLAPEACAEIAGVTVLVVDDEPDARALVQRFLEDCDAKVTATGSAAEALKLVQQLRPDVLVSDIGMPTEDGYSLIRNVRALDPKKGGDTPAIALTAYARAEDRVNAIMAGFQHHVSKPVEPAELIAMIASLTSRKR